MPRLWPLLLFLCACYSPDWLDGHYSCDSSTPCPPGFTCGADKKCHSTTPSGGADMTGSAPTPCSGEGVAVAGDGSVWACKGTFAAMTYAGLCNANLAHACRWDSSADVAKLNLVQSCPMGFYMMAPEISASMHDGDLSCPAQMDETANLVGCGTENGTSTRKGNNCNSLNNFKPLTLFACGPHMPPVSWSCNKGVADAVHTDASMGGGVLCCKN